MRVGFLVIFVLLTSCSRREKLHYPKQSPVWPRYDLKVQLSLRSKLPQALSCPASERAKALAGVVETARVMMGRPELSRADRQRLVDLSLLAAEGVGLTGYVSPGFTSSKPVPFESLARRWLDYAKASPELQTWLESEAQSPDSRVAKLAEALLAAFDQYMRWRVQKVRETRPKEELIEHRTWTGDTSLYWRPAGERGDALRDTVLLYVAVTRPNRQLTRDLDDLAWSFELELDEWDAARTLARLGRPDM
ncbi:MAG: hypothetical protein FJ279_34860, partial [Planctomycetes bacterium]|nr:hypothetical protein [Planctomycetota bacterium]